MLVDLESLEQEFVEAVGKIAAGVSGDDSFHSLAYVFNGTNDAIHEHTAAIEKLADAISAGFSELAASIRSLKS